jgi:hypothetical protein
MNWSLQVANGLLDIASRHIPHKIYTYIAELRAKSVKHLHLARHALLDHEQFPHAQAASLYTCLLLLHTILHLYTETDAFREPFWTFGSLSKGLTF